MLVYSHHQPYTLIYQHKINYLKNNIKEWKRIKYLSCSNFSLTFFTFYLILTLLYISPNLPLHHQPLDITSPPTLTASNPK